MINIILDIIFIFNKGYKGVKTIIEINPKFKEIKWLFLQIKDMCMNVLKVNILKCVTVNCIYNWDVVLSQFMFYLSLLVIIMWVFVICLCAYNLLTCCEKFK